MLNDARSSQDQHVLSESIKFATIKSPRHPPLHQSSCVVLACCRMGRVAHSPDVVVVSKTDPAKLKAAFRAYESQQAVIDV